MCPAAYWTRSSAERRDAPGLVHRRRIPHRTMKRCSGRGGVAQAQQLGPWAVCPFGWVGVCCSPGAVRHGLGSSQRSWVFAAWVPACLESAHAYCIPATSTRFMRNRMRNGRMGTSAIIWTSLAHVLAVAASKATCQSNALCAVSTEWFVLFGPTTYTVTRHRDQPTTKRVLT